MEMMPTGLDCSLPTYTPAIVETQEVECAFSSMNVFLFTSLNVSISSAEIFSYVVDGELTHQDSIGNKESLGRGAVQYMSAGTGVIHSEMNDHPKDICRFLQVWLLPDRPGHVPQYGSLNTISAQRHNSLLAVLQGTGNIPDWAVPIHSDDDPIRLHQDATVVVSETDPGFRQRIRLGKSRQAYIVCIEGTLDLVPEIPLQQNDSTSGVSLEMREAVEVVPADTGIALDLVAGGQGAHVMIIEMGKDTVQR